MKFKILIGALLATTLLASPVFADGKKDKKAKADKEVPAGLQKKVENGGELPPGWKKKLKKGEKLDKAVIDAGKVIESDTKAGTITIKVDDKVVRLAKATQEIIEVLQ